MLWVLKIGHRTILSCHCQTLNGRHELVYRVARFAIYAVVDENEVGIINLSLRQLERICGCYIPIYLHARLLGKRKRRLTVQ